VLDENGSLISIQPVISYPREVRAGKTYLMAIDLRVPEDGFIWPYEEEEIPVYCFVDASTLFDSEPLGDSTIVLHRFGGTYGPAEFVLTATNNPQESDIQITLTSVYGKPIKVIVLSDVRVIKDKVKRTRLKAVTETKPILVATPILKQKEEKALNKRTRLPSNRQLPGKPIPINLGTSKIVVAIAQVNGPLPDGKQKVVIADRETLEWKSLDDIRSRLEKAYAILDEISTGPLKPDIVVFPEYAFPVQRAVGELQQRADKYNFIIVGGADLIRQSNSAHIFNQSPIMIPGHAEPVWVTKRTISQWEEGLVDEPGEITQPVLTWKVNGLKYWISTYISLDFSFGAQRISRGGGLFLVPMCSPDVMSFRGWADTLLRLEGGTATVLCNCVGGGSKGQSSVVVSNPSGKPFQAAFEMSTNREEVSVFEIDLQHLAPPRKTSRRTTYALGRRFLYELQTVPGGIRLEPQPTATEEILKRAVINPAIFSAVLGKKMRMAFLNVRNYAEVETKIEGKDYEVLATLGKEDIIVTHLAEDRYDMIFDITQAINWIGVDGNYVTVGGLNEMVEASFPHFRVDAYYKVMGVPVNDVDRGVFSSRERPFPNFAEIANIFKLGQRWEDPDVTDEERQRFLHNRWILDLTELNLGDINAVMTIGLAYARVDSKAHLLAKFEETVVPELVNNHHVTSLYRGSSVTLVIDYVARLSCDIRSISDLQYRLHDMALKNRLSIQLTTYIVHKKLSSLSLPKAILVTRLSRDKRYRDLHIIPHLSDEDRVRLTYQSEREQIELIDSFRTVEKALEKIDYFRFETEERMVLHKLASGLFNKDFDSLREVHDPLQIRVEKMIAAIIKKEIDEKEFKQLAAAVNISPQKTKSQLAYMEKIKIAVRHFEETESESLRLPSLKNLHLTTLVRNALAHSDFERISLEQFTQAMVYYCNFLYDWDENLTKTS